MSGVVVLRPGAIVPVEGPAIFFNGPIQGTSDWQSEAIDRLKLYAGGMRFAIALPRHEYLDDEFVYEQQVDWETHDRELAHRTAVNIFWLAAETDHNCQRAYAQTSRAELFESKMQHQLFGRQLVIGIAEGFSGARYIRHRFGQDCPEVTICDDLDTTLRVAVTLLRRVGAVQ